MKAEGEPGPHKRFRVELDVQGSDALASFDTLDEAIADVRRRRSDWRYVIRDFRTIVWPERRAKD
jgi:hypothetical protein